MVSHATHIIFPPSLIWIRLAPRSNSKPSSHPYSTLKYFLVPLHGSWFLWKNPFVASRWHSLLPSHLRGCVVKEWCIFDKVYQKQNKNSNPKTPQYRIPTELLTCIGPHPLSFACPIGPFRNLWPTLNIRCSGRVGISFYRPCPRRHPWWRSPSQSGIWGCKSPLSFLSYQVGYYPRGGPLLSK